MLGALRALFIPKPPEAVEATYIALVNASRNPFFYTELKVPDSIDGRFDMIVLHLFLLQHRLVSENQASFSQFLSEAFFNDLDANLREMGLLLVLDDFGTGFSSLSHLQRAKFDAVKIDRSFVRGVVEPGTDRSIVTAILALAEALDIDVVAEGVESRDQADALRGLGCRWAQGFLYDRPLAPDVLAERMSRPVLRSVPAPSATTLGDDMGPTTGQLAITQ